MIREYFIYQLIAIHNQPEGKGLLFFAVVCIFVAVIDVAVEKFNVYAADDSFIVVVGTVSVVVVVDVTVVVVYDVFCLLTEN